MGNDGVPLKREALGDGNVSFLEMLRFPRYHFIIPYTQEIGTFCKGVGYTATEFTVR